MGVGEEIPHNDYMRLKPIAKDILYSIISEKLHYAQEINKIGTIVRILYETEEREYEEETSTGNP